MSVFLDEVLNKVVASLVIMLVVGCFHLWGRVRDLEKDASRLKDHPDKCPAEDYAANQVSFTVLMTKIDTLLETALKRLDILEKHVFHM